MFGKSEITWMQIKLWLLANPDKTAAIVTPEATYVIKVEPAIPYVKHESITEWISKEFK